MRISDVCIRDVATCLRSARVREVARAMRERHVGTMIVVQPCDGEVMPVGILTDRDLVVRVIAEGCDADALTAGDVMHGQVVTARASEELYDAIQRMGRLGIGRLPVVDDHGHLLGILTASDAIQLLAQELGEFGRVSPRRIEVEEKGTPAPGPCHWPPRAWPPRR